MKKGICVGGVMTVDFLYPVPHYPKSSELTTITEDFSQTTGGAVCNVLGAISRLCPDMPLYAIGRSGGDANGDYIVEELNRFGNIDTSTIVREGRATFTAVITDQSSKERTLFTYPGASGNMTEEDVQWDKINANIFHIAYVLMMPNLDSEDAQYGTKMARLFCHAQEKGYKTSIDIVSEMSGRAKKLMPPALKYTDYCIINELEAQETTGILLRDEDKKLHPENMEKALDALKAMGVSTWIAIHCPEGVWGMDENGQYVYVQSLTLPRDYIKGTVGAGDAFCGGVLCGAENGMNLHDALVLGTATASCALGDESANAGVPSLEKTLEFYEKMR